MTPIVEQQDTKNSEEPKPYCSQFDLTRRITKEALEEAKTNILQWDYQGNEDYKTLMDEIRKVVLEGNFSSAVPVAPGTARHALRVAIHSIASPSWQSKSLHVRLQILLMKMNPKLYFRIYINSFMLFVAYFVSHSARP